MLSNRYSPKEAVQYQITALPRCEVSSILSLQPPRSVAVWNLFWLSVPAIDTLLEHGSSPNYYRHYMPVADAARSVTADALNDEVLYRKLLMTPDSFLNFFENEEDHSIYDCYETLGGDDWVETVITRARAARARQAQSWGTGLGNVLQLFRKRLEREP